MKGPTGLNLFLKNSGVTLAMVLWVCAGSAVPIAGAEDPAVPPAPAPATPPAATAAAPAVVALNEGYLSDLSSHAVVQLLRSIESPTLDHYKAAAMGLKVARRWRPTDAELLRQEIEAWDANQDQGRVLACTRELVKLDPLDTVALLKVVSARMTGLQDADQRLKAYEGLLTSKTIDASVRSRLALDAGLLARETGDERGFLDRLLLASTLDVTNKEAAALTVTTYLDKSKDPKERFDLLTTLLLADPHDAEAHRNLAYELRRQMAFKASARFLDLARGLNSVEGRDPTAAQQLEYFQSLWDSIGPDKCVNEIQRMLDLELINEEMRRSKLEKSGRSAGPEVDIRLPPAIERVRLMVHVARMDDAGAAASFRSLKASHEEALTRLATDPPKAKEGEELPVHMRADSIRRTLLLDYLWIRLFSGINLEDAEKDLDELCTPGADGALALSPVSQDRFRGWLKVIRGDLAGGRALLEPLLGKDSSARWILGVAAQREGDIDKAAEYFGALAREQAASAVGSAARQRWERIKGLPMPTGPVAAMLETEGQKFAPWLLSIVNDPRAFVSLTVAGTKPKLDPFDRAEAVITLGNACRHPMGVGVGRSINPRVLLAAQVLSGGDDISTKIRPEVINLSRRLRLMPGEAMTTTVWGGRGDLTTEFDARATSQANLRWTVTQGFIFSDGGFRAGPNSVRAQSVIIQRNPIGNTIDAILDPANPRMRGDARSKALEQIKAETLAETVLNAPEPQSLRPLALACFRVGPERREAAASLDPVTEPDARTLAAALTERLGKTSAIETALIIQHLTVGKGMDDGLKAACIDAVKRVNHAGLWLAALALMADGPEHPLVAAAESALASDADMGVFVSLVKAGFNRSSVAAPQQVDDEVKIVPVGPDGTGEPGAPGGTKK
jgi:tetratricopeptide (TPR) repeat protein